MQVRLHEAENCMNELAACKKPWFHKDRFDIIKKWMEKYYIREQEFQKGRREALGSLEEDD